ncbi:UNVERIFIED_CONTAM: hypothetical protein NY603_26770, partial [Bacteroidetes bacterium 56_B9]
MWLVAYGSFYYACECKRDRQIIKWSFNKELATCADRPVICDVEYVSGFGFIFIDCLTDVSGKPVSASRDLDDSL